MTLAYSQFQKERHIQQEKGNYIMLIVALNKDRAQTDFKLEIQINISVCSNYYYVKKCVTSVDSTIALRHRVQQETYSGYTTCLITQLSQLFILK